MKVGIKKLDNPIGYYTYGYDQLNRIVKMDAWKDAETISEKYKEEVKYDPNGNIKTYLRHNDEGIPMDRLRYNYASDNNKLRHINDTVPDNVNAQDIDDQKEDNYIYDCSGNLIEDKSDKVKISWNLYGKVTDVKQNGTANFLTYGYDPMQNRALKVSGTGSAETKTYYFRDAQGNVLATYRLKNDVFSLEEVDIYGSRRLGLLKPNLQIYPSVNTENKDIEGKKRYELSNHLGNVLAVISDRKKGSGNLNGNYTYFDAITFTATDYFPFGMSMPGRTLNTEGYRYSFNGKEDDNEWAKQDYGFRMYDKLSGRFWSIDPLTKKYPELTPYQFASNRPIDGIDQDGLEFEPYWSTSAPQKQHEYEKQLRQQNPQGASDILYQKNKEAGLFIASSLGPLTRVVTWFGVISFASNHHIGDNLRRSGNTAEAQKYYNSGNSDGLPVFLGIGVARILGLAFRFNGNLLPEFEVKAPNPIYETSLKVDITANSGIKPPFKIVKTKILGSEPIEACNLSENGCEKIADKVKKAIGGDYLQITSDYKALGGVKYNGSTGADLWSWHVAVIKEGKVFDQMTGSSGLLLEEYKKLFNYSDVLKFETVSKRTLK